MVAIKTNESASISAHQTRHGNVTVPYVTAVEIDVNVAEKLKGGNLAAGDTIELLKVPAKSVVKGVWAIVTQPSTEDATVTTLAFGPIGGTALVTVNTGTSPDEAISAGTMDTLVTADTMYGVTVGAVTAGTADAPLDGVVQFLVELVDVSKKIKAGIVKLGS